MTMHSNKHLFPIAVVTLTLSIVTVFVPGCGKVAEVAVEKMAETAIEQGMSGEAQVNIDAENGKISMQMEDGENTINMQTGENVPLPSDFPADVPVPDGATWILVQTSTGDDGGLMLQGTVSIPMDSLVKTLKSQAETQGWETIQNISQPGQLEMMTYSKGEKTLSYTLGKDNDKTTIMVACG